MQRHQKINTALGIGYFICIIAMIWPGALIANRIEPFVLGLPFLFFWYVAWVFLLFLGLAAAYWLEYGGSE